MCSSTTRASDHRYRSATRSIARESASNRCAREVGPSKPDDRMTLKPPSDLICTDEEHYHKGGQWVEYFASVCGLRRDERVLDVGSGGGRVAVPLTDYLTGGTYDGFDTSAHDVTWCRENVTPRAPNFTFRHVDIRNQTYNPAGTIDPLRFRFPYDDSSFDFVFLTSIFTHMLPV